MAQHPPKANRRNAAALSFFSLGLWWGVKRAQKEIIVRKILVLGHIMGTAIKAGFGVALAVVVFLVGYGYLVDFAPKPAVVTQPLVLNAQ